MKAIIIFSILIAIALITLMYRRESNLKKMLFSFLLLAGVVSLGVLGGVMRSVMPLFLIHIVALTTAYIGIIIYILRDKLYWYLYLSPFTTVAIYLLLAWVGNEHI